jgi:hypothetical protein
VRECCWKRVTELADLYKDELPRDTRQLLEQRREQVAARAGEVTVTGA